MNIYIQLGIFGSLFVLYWFLLSVLVDVVLEAPKLKHAHWIFVGCFNFGVVFYVDSVYGGIMLPYCIMMVLLFIDLLLFYKDKIAGALLCTLACAVHVISVFMIVISASSMFTGLLPYELLSDEKRMMLIAVISFAILDAAIWGVIKIVPLVKVKVINQHEEQRWFIIAWMAVNSIFLLYMASAFNNPLYPINLSGNQVAASLASLVSIYIVLYFSFKSSELLGYKEKNAELEQEIRQEQQYRNSMLKDAVASYEINVTQDLIIKGFEDPRCKENDKIYRYSDLLVFMSREMIYSEDVAEFIRNYGRANILRLVEKGKMETSVEYRRLLDNGNYAWVRALINFVHDTATGDVKAFLCIKNIDAEKKDQLELQRKAERDSLTGLYNKSMAGKMVDEHLLFSQNGIRCALFMIDVDDFKNINDHLGQIFGDAVLCELAEKLVKIFGDGNIVGRVGGDEFIAFLGEEATVKRVEEKASEICKAFRITYNGEDGASYKISSSIGISLFPNAGSSFMELYNRADVALYMAKDKGKDGYRIYDGSGFVGYTSGRTEIQSNGNLVMDGFRQNRIEYIFKMLYQSENSVAAIHSALELVSRHFHFERGYIFETSKDGKTTDNTFEWCAEGITAEIGNLQKVPIEAVSTANANFYDKGMFILRNLDELPANERDLLEPQGIQSMFQFGIFDRGKLLGFIGFDNCKSQIMPSDAEIDEMRTVCNVLSTFFVKQYVDDVSARDLLARQEVLNHLDNYIYVINMETFEILFTNEKIQRLINKSEFGAACYSFFRGNKSQCEDCPIYNLKLTNTERSITEIYNDKLGIWMETSASIMRWTDGNLACLVNCTDISKQKEESIRYVHQLEQMVYVDELTGCRTYHKFKKDAPEILERQPDKLHFIVKLDVANFKLINQIYGYEKGDEILQYVARAIEKTIRNENEIFARVNNDEFIALFTLQNAKEAEELNEKFINHFHSLIGNDFLFKFKFPHGRYLILPDTANKTDINDMFEKVNIAHKAAKLDKAVSFVYYDESMTREALRVKEIENKMAESLEEGEFIIFLQPKYYLENETIGGAEALTRWKNSNTELFFPNTFIPVFEQNGFITKLDFYIFKKVCDIIKGWMEEGIEPVVVSVNFSRLHLGNINFVNELCKIVDSVGVDRRYLEIEITETVIYDNIDTLEILLRDIHDRGFSMSMDDFGSGYSSLGMLKNLPVDVIKMDRSFFANQKDAERSKTVVGSIIQMAAGLGIRIVAEGVEEQAHINFLRDLHCDMVQGYYYAKPMPVEDFTDLLRKG